MSIAITKIGAVSIVHQNTLVLRQSASGLLRFLTAMLAPVIGGVQQATEHMQPLGQSVHLVSTYLNFSEFVALRNYGPAILILVLRRIKKANWIILITL